MTDPYSLKRFVDAQGPVMTQVLAELSAGHKRSHWMWFVFPQLESLGRSAMARHYGISSLDEARAYLAHPVLRIVHVLRLRRCAADRDEAQVFVAQRPAQRQTLEDLFCEELAVAARLLDVKLGRVADVEHRHAGLRVRPDEAVALSWKARGICAGG